MIPGRRLFPLLLLAAAAVRAAGPAPASVAPVDTIITSDDAEIQSTDAETTSDFTGHVVVTGTNLIIHCDRLIVVTTKVSDKSATIGDPTGFKSLLAIGHVHIQQNDGLREATCGQAQVFPATDKIVLTQDPVVFDRGASGESRATGDVLELYKGQRQVKGHNVRITMPPMKDLGFDKNEKQPAATPGTPSSPGPSAPAPPKPKPAPSE